MSQPTPETVDLPDELARLRRRLDENPDYNAINVRCVVLRAILESLPTRAPAETPTLIQIDEQASRRAELEAALDNIGLSCRAGMAFGSAGHTTQTIDRLAERRFKALSDIHRVCERVGYGGSLLRSDSPQAETPVDLPALLTDEALYRLVLRSHKAYISEALPNAQCAAIMRGEIFALVQPAFDDLRRDRDKWKELADLLSLPKGFTAIPTDKLADLRREQERLTAQAEDAEGNRIVEELIRISKARGWEMDIEDGDTDGADPAEWIAGLITGAVNRRLESAEAARDALQQQLTAADAEATAGRLAQKAARQLVMSSDRTRQHMTTQAVNAAVKPLTENVESERDMNARLTAELEQAQSDLARLTVHLEQLPAKIEQALNFRSVEILLFDDVFVDADGKTAVEVAEIHQAIQQAIAPCLALPTEPKEANA